MELVMSILQTLLPSDPDYSGHMGKRLGYYYMAKIVRKAEVEGTFDRRMRLGCH